MASLRFSIRFLLVLLGVVAGGCTDDEPFRGKYREFYPVEQETYAQDTALELDLFQFGDEVGGIVRYYSTREAERFGIDPYQTEPRRCFWTEPVRIAEGQTSFQLRYRDEFQSEVILRIQSDAIADVLNGRISLFSSGQTQDPTLVDLGIQRANEGRDEVQLTRLTGETPDNVCEIDLDTTRDFTIGVRVDSSLYERARDELDGTLCDCPEGTYCDPNLGTCQESESCDVGVFLCDQQDLICDPTRDVEDACVPDTIPGVLTATIVWPGAVQSPDRSDWFARVTDFTQSVGTLRWEKTFQRTLAPGRWDEPPIALFEAGDDARVGLGVIFVYREDDAILPGSEVEVDLRRQQWDPADELVFGTPFRRVERENGAVYQGPVILYIDGDLDTLSRDFLDYFPDDPLKQPRTGYGIYDIEFDAEFSSILNIEFRDIAQNSRWIDIFPRPLNDILDPSDPARRLPRLDRLNPAQ